MKTIIFDNAGTTFDRYTIILPDGETFGASHNPFNPQGFGQYCGNVVELAFPNVANAWYNYKKGCYPKDAIKLAKTALKNDFKQRGETLCELTELPEDVQKYINQLLTI